MKKATYFLLIITAVTLSCQSKIENKIIEQYVNNYPKHVKVYFANDGINYILKNEYFLFKNSQYNYCDSFYSNIELNKIDTTLSQLFQSSGFIYYNTNFYTYYENKIISYEYCYICCDNGGGDYKPLDKFSFEYDSLNRFTKIYRMPILSRCSGLFGEIDFSYSKNNDTTYAYSFADGCGTFDTLIYNDSLHVSNIPCFGTFYPLSISCGKFYTDIIDNTLGSLLLHSNYNYKLIKSISSNNYQLHYSYSFNSENDVNEMVIDINSAKKMKYVFEY